MSENVVSEIVRSRDYYKGVLDNCRSHLVHSVVNEAGLVRCPRCGRIYSKASIRDKCPYCYETPVVELSYTPNTMDVGIAIVGWRFKSEYSISHRVTIEPRSI